MKRNELRAQVAIAVRACQEKKGADISILQLDEQASGFTDYFVICSGANPRQVQAIADEVDQKLSATGVEPSHREGYNQAEWVLLDYVDFVVHIFSESARKFYDLERLWKIGNAAATLRSGEACPQTRCEEGNHSCKASPGGQIGSEVYCQDRSQARLNHPLAQEIMSREASHRMDWQDPQFAHPIPHCGIPEAALALRRLRRARAGIRSSAA